MVKEHQPPTHTSSIQLRAKHMVGNGATFEIQKNDFPKNDILRAKMAIFHKVTDMTGTQKKEQK